MKFYDVLSNYYDSIFPLNNTAVNMLKKYFEGKEEVLDIACGSGNYAIELERLGYDVTAIDLDEEMIEKLKSKKNRDSEIEFRKMNMLDIEKLNKSFGGVFCIGNSLVHLNDIDEINTFMKGVYDVLNEKGIFICQIVNYDRVLDKNINQLPTINKPEDRIKFIRNYHRSNGKIEFEGIIELREGETFKNTVELYPLRKAQIISALKEAGFEQIKFFGSFNEDDHDEESFATVFIATK